jgi:pimeloyl-ACP methyl ester carboxylesterase
MARPEAGLHVFEGCGHMLTLEAPARVKAVLRAMATGDQRPR